MREKNCADIRDVVHFSLLVDESKNISKKEQMSIMLRYVQEGMCMNVSFALSTLAILMRDLSWNTFVQH